MVAVLNYLALTGTFLSLALLLPALIGFGFGQMQSGTALLIYSALGGFLFFSMLIAIRGRKVQLDRVNSVALVVLGWLIFPLILALPLSDLFSISYRDAVFEAVSAMTTTAADGIRAPETAPKAAIFLRAVIQWFGGLATLLTFILFLGPIRAGGMPKPRLSAGEATGRSISGIYRIVWRVLRTMVAATLICFSLLMLAGVDAYSSAILASTAVTAGGYIPPGKALLDVTPPLAMTVMAVFFLIAATSVFWHQMFVRAQWVSLKRHRESYYLIAIALSLAAVFFAVLVEVSGSRSFLELPRFFAEALFNGASLAGTSGLQSRPGVFALVSPLLVLSLLVIGGGCYSTASGIKLYRLGGMLFHAGTELSRLVYPHGVPRTKFGNENYDLQIMKAIWTMFMAAILVITLGSFALALTGLSYQASLTAAVAAFSNAGPAYSTDWVPRGTVGWLDYPDMAVNQKLVLAALMLCGRLEVVAIVAALNPLYWLRR